MQRRDLAKLFSSCLLASITPGVWAQRPIEIWTSVNTGGASDVLMRHLMTDLPINAVLKHYPGGHGAVLLNKYANVTDTNTYLYTTSGVVAGVSFLQGVQLGLNPLNDLTPLALTSLLPMYLFARADQPDGLLAFKDKTEIFHGSLGNNSADTVAGHSFLKAAQIPFKQINYTSGHDAMRDLLNGQLDVVTASLNTASAFLDTQKIKVLASFSHYKDDKYAHLRASKLLGQPFDVAGWAGLFKHKALRTPEDDTLLTQIKQTYHNPVFMEKARALSLVPHYEEGEVFRARIQADVKRYEGFLRVA